MTPLLKKNLLQSINDHSGFGSDFKHYAYVRKMHGHRTEWEPEINVFSHEYFAIEHYFVNITVSCLKPDISRQWHMSSYVMVYMCAIWIHEGSTSFHDHSGFGGGIRLFFGVISRSTSSSTCKIASAISSVRMSYCLLEKKEFHWKSTCDLIWINVFEKKSQLTCFKKFNVNEAIRMCFDWFDFLISDIGTRCIRKSNHCRRDQRNSSNVLSSSFTIKSTRLGNSTVKIIEVINLLKKS